MKITSLEQLFNLCVAIPFSGCWLWGGGANSAGYGYLCGVGLIHRRAFALANGKEAIGLVCHRCDVPLCVNPAHLYDGTKSTNQKDAIARGQSPKPPRRPSAVTDEQLSNIARLMLAGSSRASACRSVGIKYQSLQRPFRRARLTELMEAGH